MKNLYAPWRTQYFNKKKAEKINKDKCPFCTKISENKDAKNFIIFRGKHNFVILNLYPYNAGHVMILPNKHVSCISDLSTKEANEFIKLTGKMVDTLKSTLGAEGINAGFNLGRAAGAGIPSHLHMHVVPRWKGDTNFISTIGEIKQISFDMNEIYKKLKNNF